MSASWIETSTRAAALALFCGCSLFSSQVYAQTGVDDDRISLPEGPGSLEGVGENVEVDPNMALMRWNIPIVVPKGYEGMTPSLALSYASGNGGGPFGIGWSMETPTIERMTSRGTPRYVTEDIFAHGGGEELVLTETAGGDRVYRERFESKFQRYTWVNVGDGKEGYWKVEYPDGRVGYFGADSEGNLVESARTSHPEGGTYRYHLVEVVDPYGHELRYNYDKFGGNKTLLTDITYVFVGDEPQYSVQFDYELRQDLLSDAGAGFEELLEYRVTNVRVLHQEQTAREYVLSYEDYQTSGGFSRLTNVQTFGVGGEAGGEDPNPVSFSFGYSRALGVTCAPEMGVDCDADRPYIRALPALQGGVSLGSGKATLIDINGDSLPDVLDTTGGTHKFFINRLSPDGNGGWSQAFDAPVSTSLNTSLELGGQSKVQVLDINGDGYADLVDTAGGNYLLNDPTRADWKEIGVGFGISQSKDINFPDARFMDYDNDKKIDIVVSDSSNAQDPLRIYINDGTGFTAQTFDGLGVAFSSPRVQLSDMNGDGLNDVIEIVGDSPAQVRYKLNLGLGRYGQWESVSNLDIDASEIANLDFEDLNGDGISDVVVVNPAEIKYMINRNGNAFDPPVTMTSGDIDGMLPVRDASTRVLYADMNANGSEDVVWFDANGNVTYLELFPTRPNLISRIDNGLGFVQQVTYGTSAEHAARAEAAGQPWEMTLPNAMPVVDKVDIFVTLTGGEDGSGLHEVIDYTYRNGFYDGLEKQFRGFGDVISTLRGDETQEEGRTIYEFDLGDQDPWFSGLMTRQIQESGGDVLNEMIDAYDDCDVDGAPAFNGDITVREQVRHVCKVSSEKIIKERRPEADWVTTRIEYTYDGFGNVTLERNLGDIDSEGDELHTETEYATSSSRWILNLPSKVTTYNDASLRSMERAEEHYFYDGDDFAGLSAGEVDQGFLTRKSTLIELPGTFIDEQRNRRDEHGNVVEVLDPLGSPSEENAHRRTYEYDPMGLYVVATELRTSDGDGNPYQLRREARYDYTLGVTLEATSWMVSRDGTPETARRSTLVSYDHLGRITSLEKPGDDPGKPSAEFVYELDAPASRVAFLSRSTLNGEVDEEAYRCFDGKGRMFQTRTKVASGEYLVTGFKAYNARGTVVREYEPYTATTAECETAPPADVRFTQTKLDAAFRPIEVTRADGELYGTASMTRTEYLPLAQVQYDEEDTSAESPHANTPTTMHMDGIGRTVSIERLLRGEGGEQVATFQLLYDNTNSLAGYIDPAGNRHEQVRDLKGRVLTVTNPNIGSVNYTYDAAGNITHVEDARGAIKRMAYDGLNRKIERWDEADREGTLATLTYDFDPNCAVTECTNTPGVLATASYAISLGEGWTSSVTERAGYDVRGQQIFAARAFERLTDLITRTEYDNAGRAIRVTHPDGTTIENSYDSAGRVVAMPGYASSVSYEDRGLLETLTFVNGATMEIGYDALQRFDTIRSKDGGGADIEGWDYTRDRVGNILNIGDLGTRAGRPGTAADFVYDDWYRVNTSQLSIGTADEEILSYTYDTIDNVLSATSSLGEESRGHIGTYAYGDRPNMATEAGELKMAYDAAGHMTSHGDAQMAWDYMGRLTSATRADGKGATYAYGVDEGRVAKVEDGSLTLYGYNDFKVRDGVAVSYARLKRQFVARHETPGFAGSFYPDADGDGSITAGDAYASSGDSAMPMRAILMASAARALAEGEDAKAFFHSDHLGSITAATDEGGAVRGQRAYYPFGDIRWEEGFVDEYGFTGQELDQLTGLLHFQFRYLDPRVGRWVSFDPLFVRLEQETIEKYAEFNGYAYVSNNPLNSVDPLGLAGDGKKKSGSSSSSSSSKGNSSTSSNSSGSSSSSSADPKGSSKSSSSSKSKGDSSTSDSSTSSSSKPNRSLHGALSDDSSSSSSNSSSSNSGSSSSGSSSGSSSNSGGGVQNTLADNTQNAGANPDSKTDAQIANAHAKKANKIAETGNWISLIVGSAGALASSIINVVALYTTVSVNIE